MAEEIKEVKEKKTKKVAAAPAKNPVQEGGVVMTPEKKAKAIKILKAAGLVAAGFVGGVLAGLFIKAKETETEVVPFDLNE